MKRRTLLQSGGALLGAAAAPALASPATRRTPVDFRFAPLESQATFCFPDDPHKGLSGEKGDLRYGYDRRKQVNYFTETVLFSLRGMEPDQVTMQQLEAPGVPIIHTRINRPEASLELTTFATNREGEGRVDNVILEVRPKRAQVLYTSPIVFLKTRRMAKAVVADGITTVQFDGTTGPFMIADAALRSGDSGDGYLYSAPELPARADRPLRLLLRFPQGGQTHSTLLAGLRDPNSLLEEARVWWRNWKPFAGGVGWRLPGTYNHFLEACTRNILQSRERVNGKLTFQVGPTTYRGLWVVDGNFILEAARYLGYDDEVQKGLETTWSMQRRDGSVVAAVESAHWKDTGIAMFSLVRQAELSQDWTYFRKMQPEVLGGVRFLRRLRDDAVRAADTTNGRYGLLARGFGDGGIGGRVRDEFTNTIWALSGLRAVTDSARRLGLDGFDEAYKFYSELRESFFSAARREMRRHNAGFEFLPMILNSDPDWSDPDERRRPRPQTGQWALAQTIYPGVLFEPGDPIVRGYVALMKACTQEDVPAETGWLPHEGLWNYDACFAAHAYLWAGEQDAALSTFTGFLNHATPLYCWREEQPLRGALVGSYVGDMPHNWASAECVLFLRHMLALEDGPRLRLLPGIAAPELAAGEPYRIESSPTRFGRIGMTLEPAGRGWRLAFKRGSGPAPTTVELPESLAGLRFSAARGASAKNQGVGRVLVDPAASSWEAAWT